MPVLWRGSYLQRLRLASGLILFAFATLHFVNHALGLISLEAMTAFDSWRSFVVRSWPGTVVLTAALAIHVVLALAKLARRRTLRLPRWEWLQIALGLVIPFFLLPHIVNTRGASVLFGVDTIYPYELARIWPATMLDQTILLIVVWVHGCMGLHFWLRLAPSYRRFTPLLLSLAVLLPSAALAGVMMQGRLLQLRIADAAQFAALKAATNWPTSAAAADIAGLHTTTRLLFYGLAAVPLLILAASLAWRRGLARIAVRYVAGPAVKPPRGPTLLEISRMFDIPHACVCGGRARCSTCRVLVVEGAEGLEPPDAAEAETLRAIQAPADVRLACQARPRTDLTVLPLIKLLSQADGQWADSHFKGSERRLAVLFVDIRGFTAMTEAKLAFDIVFILNSFFEAVGRPITRLGGRIDKYAGDGLMAIFGTGNDIAEACRAAFLATAEIDRALAALNATLSDEIPEPLRIAMGLHAGTQVVGKMGFADTATVTLIGPSVNIASRLEALAKARNAQLAFSREAAIHAGLDLDGLKMEAVDIRGVSAPVEVVFVDRSRKLVERLHATA